MKIEILTSSKHHPVYADLLLWKKWAQGQGHEVAVIAGGAADVTGGDFLFLISCSAIVREEVRKRFRHVIVVHASDLPRGRGWSPAVWQILDGQKDIIVTALEAADKVDSGPIWLKESVHFEGHELADEIHARLNSVTKNIMSKIIETHQSILPVQQSEDDATYFSRRTPEDSRIDPEQSIASQFELLRVADPERYPAFFDYRGHRYYITLRKGQ